MSFNRIPRSIAQSPERANAPLARTQKAWRAFGLRAHRALRSLVMGMFFCQECGNLSDSDDGCEEGTNFRLICAYCVDNRQEAEDEAADTIHRAPAPPRA